MSTIILNNEHEVFDASIVGSEVPEGWSEDDLTEEPVEQVIDGEEEGAA